MTSPERDPRVPAAFHSATQEDPHAPVGEGTPDVGRATLPDPLRLCVATTVALIAWVVTPALAVAVFAGIALVAYARARRAGLLASRCKLGDTRLVLAYLGVALVAGVVGTVWRLVG